MPKKAQGSEFLLKFKKLLWAHVVSTGLATVALQAACVCWVQFFC